jgi:hypothetical protein
VHRARIGVNAAQHAQGVIGVLVGHSGCLLALLPQMGPPALSAWRERKRKNLHRFAKRL